MNKKAFGGMPLKWAGVLAVTGILLAGCASSSTEGDGRASAPAADTNTGTTISGTGGQLIAIQSDNVAAAGYDAASRTMLVEFKDGSLYEYSPVPESVWMDFVAAQPHPWGRVGNPVLVEGGVPYRKVRCLCVPGGGWEHPSGGLFWVGGGARGALVDFPFSACRVSAS